MTKNDPIKSSLNSVKADLRPLELEIDRLPEINLLTLPVAFLRNLVKPNQNEDLYEQLEYLRSKTQSTLDTYARGAKEASEEGNPIYLSQIMQTLDKISTLEDRLRRRDLQRVLSTASQEEPAGKSKPTNTHRYRKNDESEWKEFKL